MYCYASAQMAALAITFSVCHEMSGTGTGTDQEAFWVYGQRQTVA